MYTQLTINIRAKNLRHETLEGREYLVAPVALITQGVHNGNNGPLYYSDEELAKSASVWDHKPIVINHPQIDGKAVSACLPSVLESRKVGLLLNTGWDRKLRAEAWLDKEKLAKVDEEVNRRVLNEEVMEVSTGLTCDFKWEAGEWNSQDYDGSVHNIRADHLAILPSEKGACSVSDGAGLFQLNQASRDELTVLAREVHSMAKRDEAISELIARDGSPWSEKDVDVLSKMSDEQFATVFDLPKPVENKKKEEPEKKKDDEQKKPAVQNAAEKGAKELQPKARSLEQYVAEAPPEIREVLESGVARLDQERTELIEVLTANSACEFTAEQLKTKHVNELKMLTKLAGVAPAPAKFQSFAGAQGVPPEVMTNAEVDEADKEPLGLPSLELLTK